jgi:hypothetical protein
VSEAEKIAAGLTEAQRNDLNNSSAPTVHRARTLADLGMCGGWVQYTPRGRYHVTLNDFGLAVLAVLQEQQA